MFYVIIIVYLKDYLIQYILYICLCSFEHFLTSSRILGGKDIIITKCCIYHMYLMFCLELQNTI